MWQAWLNLAVGIWLIICGFVHPLQTPAIMIVSGIAAIVFGFWSAARVNSGQGTIIGIIGIWLLLSSGVLILPDKWNFFASGILVAVLAVWNLAGYEAPRQINSAR